MEIRFCTVCNESIPDGEFDAGRAIVYGDRSQHVACALRRSVQMSGTRSWLTFGLALVAAVISVYLLVAKLGAPKGPPEMVVVPAVIERHVTDAIRDSERRVDVALVASGRRLKDEFQASFDGRLAEHGATVREATVEAMNDLLRGTSDTMSSRLRALDAQVAKIHHRMADIVDWKLRIQREADQLRRDLDAAAQRQPVPVPGPKEEPTAQPTPPPTEPEVDAQREKEIDRWIKRLRDSDEDIVFSATIELARLKALRATPELALVLNKHKDFYARLGAATALGEIKAIEAVPDLIEALDDKDDLVRTAADEALQRITGEDFNFVSGLTKNERIRIQKKWRAWWKDHEDELRRKLDQVQK